MPKNPKKKSRRSATKYPALTRNMNLKSRRYFIEAEYINGNGDIRALTEEEKKYLNQFYEEYINTVFKRDGKDLHLSDEKRKEIYRQNNQRHFCLYNWKQRHGELYQFNADYYDKISSENYGHLDVEEILTNELEAKEIAEIIIDAKDKLKKTFPEIVEIVKTRFPSYFYRNFSEKELKNMKISEMGETLYIEAKMLLE